MEAAEPQEFKTAHVWRTYRTLGELILQKN